MKFGLRISRSENCNNTITTDKAKGCSKRTAFYFLWSSLSCSVNDYINVPTLVFYGYAIVKRKINPDTTLNRYCCNRL